MFTDVKVAERQVHMVSSLTHVDKKVVVLTKLTPAAHTEVIKTIEHHADVKLDRKNTTIKITKETTIKVGDPHHVGKLPAIPKHLETPKAIVRPPAVVIPAHVEKVVPKYELPKPPRASGKPHSSLNRPAGAWMAQAEWANEYLAPRWIAVSRLL